MKSNFVKKMESVMKDIALSLFFVCLLYTTTYIFLKKDIDLVVALINQVNINVIQSDNEKVVLDPLKKKLDVLPKYGSIWATLEIPKINRKLNVYQGDDLGILRNGVGHYQGSYFSGEGGAIVLAAHNSEKYFARLPELEVGDKITIKALYGTYNYEIFKTKVIHKTEEENFPINDEEEILMMYTCYPVNTIGFKQHRFVVYAKLVGDDNE